MTDDSNIYPKIGKKFARHSVVNHSIEEYVRGGAHVNTAENYFSILKRGIIGVYHHVTHEHLPMYLPSSVGKRLTEREDQSRSKTSLTAKMRYNRIFPSVAFASTSTKRIF